MGMKHGSNTIWGSEINRETLNPMTKEYADLLWDLIAGDDSDAEALELGVSHDETRGPPVYWIGETIGSSYGSEVSEYSPEEVREITETRGQSVVDERKLLVAEMLMDYGLDYLDDLNSIEVIDGKHRCKLLELLNEFMALDLRAEKHTFTTWM